MYRTLGTGDTLIISKNKQIVPEPATICLLAIDGLTMLMLYKMIDDGRRPKVNREIQA